MEGLVEDGLVTIEDDRLVVNKSGRLLLRNIAMCFDAYLESMKRGSPVFSRTV
jgi:oxygen-independent coproporphyrinogen-3 oxidase